MSSTKDFFKGGGTYANRMIAIEQQLNQLIASRIGEEVSFPTWMQPNAMGWVQKNGASLSKTTYAALWNAVKDEAVDKTTWDGIAQASAIDACSVYADLGGDTFRVPTVGQGGFVKHVGSNGYDIGFEKAGFVDQIQNITGSIDTSAGYGFDAFYDGETIGAFKAHGKSNYRVSTIAGAVANKFRAASFDASRVARTGTETTPQGFYSKVWIYTGNIVSDLPEPTPDWLAQQAVNTDAIADLKVYPTKWKSIESDLQSGIIVNSPNEIMARWEDANTYHVKGIVRAKSSSIPNGVNLFSVPFTADVDAIQYSPAVGGNDGHYAYLRLQNGLNMVDLAAGEEVNHFWVMIDAHFVVRM